MPNFNVPNIVLSEGKFRKVNVLSLSSIAMGTGVSPQTEVDIPAYGDLVGLQLVLTQTTAGTLTGAKTLDYAIDGLAVKDKSGRPIWQRIRGVDLAFLERYLSGKGRSRTVPTTSGSSQTHSYYIPTNIEFKDMVARIQVSLAAYSAMATSGATGGTVSLDVIAYYVDKSNAQFTQRIQRTTQTIGAGTYRLGPILPKQVAIQHLLFKVGTESNITSLLFSSDGRQELDDITPTQLANMDDVVQTSGHVTGQFSLYNSPFVSDTKTIFDIQGAGSDSVELFIVTAD